MTNDTFHECLTFYENDGFSYSCYFKTMDLTELNCPEDGVYSVFTFTNQNYPTIIENINNIPADLDYTRSVTLLYEYNFDFTGSGCYKSNLLRDYWLNTEEDYLIFRINKGKVTRDGYIKLSETFVHEIGLEKK